MDIAAEFPTSLNHLFLQHAGTAPLPTRSRLAVEEAVRAMNETRGWGQLFMDDWAALRSAIGRLISASPEQVAITLSTAHGLSLLAAGLNWRNGDNIVGVNREYPTNLLPWMALERLGVQLRLVDPVDGRVPAEAVLGAIDSSTRAVAISHVQFWNGYRVDVARIGEECRRRGVILAVDGAQSAGAIRVDVAAMSIDLFATTAYKWLLGPPGVGFCFVDANLVNQLIPAMVGPGSVANPTVFDPVLEYAHTAQRFEEGAVSWMNVAAFLGSISLLEEVGKEAIEKQLLTLTEYVGHALEDAGFEIAPPWPRRPEESSGILAFRKTGTTLEELTERLEAAKITGRVRGDFLRISPHFYNTELEMQRVVSTLTKE